MSDRGLASLGSAHAEVEVERVRAGSRERAREQVAEEVPVAFVYNGVPFAVMLASPLDLEDFAVGFSLTEGIIGSFAEFGDVEVVPEHTGYSVYVSVPKARSAVLAKRRKNLAGRTGCGLCGEQMLENALRPAPAVAGGGPFTAASVQAAMSALAGGQQLNILTGAVHAAGWADAAGNLRWLREDVGRHNALDKLIGALARTGVDAAAGFVVVTSRASYEMVHKTAIAGIPMLAAVSAPTALAIRHAHETGLTLAGFAREGRQTLYAHPARLQDRG
jgi:FdhD protein